MSDKKEIELLGLQMQGLHPLGDRQGCADLQDLRPDPARQDHRRRPPHAALEEARALASNPSCSLRRRDRQALDARGAHKCSPIYALPYAVRAIIGHVHSSRPGPSGSSSVSWCGHLGRCRSAAGHGTPFQGCSRPGRTTFLQPFPLP